MRQFLDAIPAAATSPLAYAAYTVAAVLFLVAGAQSRMAKTLLQKISAVPSRDRLRTIQIAADTVLPDKISAKEWLRLKQLRWTFMLIASILLLGFSVFVIAAIPHDSEPLQPINRVEEVRQEIERLRGTWETLDEGNSVAVQRVFGEAPTLAARMLRLDQNLNLGQRIDRDEWSGYAYFMAADAAHRLGNTDIAGEWIDLAVKHLKSAQSHIARADKLYQDDSTESYYSKLQGEIDRCHDRERIIYLLAMTLALDRFVRGNHTDKEVVRLVSSVPPQRLADMEVNPRHTPYVNEILVRNNWRF